jgi:hypothetical protein
MAELPKLRSDLVSSPSEIDGELVYTVKDPVGGNYFRLRAPEHWLVHQFDGRSTAQELAERFNAKYNSNLPAEAVDQFVGVMDKLLFLDNSRSEQTIGRFSASLHTGTSRLGRLLFVQLKAFKPGAFLERLTSMYRPFHRPFWFLIQGLVILTGLSLLFANSDQFAVSLVELWRLDSIVLMVASIFGILVLHEFAHAVVCRLHGGEVREMGFLLIYFQPGFYCDLSDAWLFERKAQRIGVTLAGPYFQLLILALSVILWRVTTPGVFIHDLAWMLVTVNWINCLFNFNPLFKLDGYYLLSDWVDIPNLRRKAFGYLGNLLQRRLLGWDVEAVQVSRKERVVFVIYSLTALIYSIWFLGYLFGLVISFLVAKAGTGGLLLFIVACLVILRSSLSVLAHGIASHFRHMRQLFKKPLKLISYLILFAVVLVSGMTVPMPHRVSGEVLLQPISEFTILLSRSGLMEKRTRFGGEAPRTTSDYLQLGSTDMTALKVMSVARDGQRVTAGDTVAIMSSNQVNAEIDAGQAELDRLSGELALLKAGPRKEEIAEVQARMGVADANLQRLLRDENRIGLLLERNGETQEHLETVQSEVAIARAELATCQSGLDLLKAPPRAEEEAVVVHQIDQQQARLRFLRQQAAAGQIVTPIDGIVRVGRGEREIMSVADAEVVEMSVPVSDFDMPLIQVGQVVQVKVRSYPDRTFEGTVIRVPAAGVETERGVIFPVTVVVSNSEQLLCDGMSGYAKIEAGTDTPFALGFRKLASTLRVEFWSWW